MTRLKEIREESGLRRKFVAEKLEISPDHLSLLERGQIALSLEKIELLSKLYNVSFPQMAMIALETYKDKRVKKC